ncbi:imidazolonepropionase-like domain-containing protein [Streptomyces albus]|uniref:imidazolonepropionase-like domain-containing protein n=1 Tax=Streptomyces albus TaxID=1888 RepID=UPI003F1D163C
MHADLLLTARHIETLGRDRPGQALAVTDGRITAVGTTDEIAALRGPATVVHEFPGATVLGGDVRLHPARNS